jgi:hypothetical protein
MSDPPKERVPPAPKQIDRTHEESKMKQLRRNNRAGQSLVEFAVVSLVLYMLLAAILTFGHMLYVAQGLQGAADLAAREISRTPLRATMTLDNPANSSDPGALHAPEVRLRIFDEAFLVIDLDKFYGVPGIGNGADIFQDAVPQMPLLNQQLATLMIVDRPDLDGDGVPDARLLRYPGALLLRTSPIAPPSSIAYPDWVATQYVIGIPLVSDVIQLGRSLVRWLPVVEEIDTENDNDNAGTNPDPFSIQAVLPGNPPIQGIVALRINYPFQSASMSSFRTNPRGPFEPTIGQPVAADDSELDPGSNAPGDLNGAPLVSTGQDPSYAGTYGGQFGLGAQGALGSEELTGGRPVRPYRRVISAQAIYRREVFE